MPARRAAGALRRRGDARHRARSTCAARRRRAAASCRRCCSAISGTTLQRGEQSLLFLNRRGYAPLTLCRACGHRFQCPDCSSWLVEHRFRGQLVCHHCGHRENRPEACPECGTLDHLVACGPGVERIAEEVVGAFPGRAHHRAVVRHAGRRQAAAARARGDRQGRGRHRHRHAARRQGPQFPQHDAGRRGRCRSRPRQWRSARRRAHLPAAQPGDRPGRAHRQEERRPAADLPAGPSGDAGDRLGRCRELSTRREIAERQSRALPPFGRLAGIIVSAQTRAEAEAHARGLRRAAPAGRATCMCSARPKRRWR